MLKLAVVLFGTLSSILWLVLIFRTPLASVKVDAVSYDITPNKDTSLVFQKWETLCVNQFEETSIPPPPPPTPLVAFEFLRIGLFKFSYPWAKIVFKRPPNFFVKGRISDRYFLNIYQALQRRPFHLSHLLEKVKYLPQTPHYLKRNDVYSVTF